MTNSTPTRLLLAGLLLLAAPCALAQHPAGGGGGGSAGRPMNPHAQEAGGGQAGGPGKSLMSGSHGGPIMGPRMNGGNAPSMHAGSAFGLGSRWWNDRKTARQLSLRSEQQQRMDRIFESNRPQLVSLYSNLQTEETRLRGLSSNDRQDETKVFAAIDRVTQARAQLQRQSQQIVVQLHQQLDAPQLALMEQAAR